MKKTPLHFVTVSMLFIFSFQLNAVSKGDPKVNSRKEQKKTRVQKQSSGETIRGKMQYELVGNYLFVRYTKSKNICMIVQHSLQKENSGTVQIFPGNEASKTFEFISVSESQLMNKEGNFEKVKKFVLCRE